MARNYIGKIHRSQILIGLLCPAMEFCLFPGVNGTSRSNFKAEKYTKRYDLQKSLCISVS